MVYIFGKRHTPTSQQNRCSSTAATFTTLWWMSNLNKVQWTCMAMSTWIGRHVNSRLDPWLGAEYDSQVVLPEKTKLQPTIADSTTAAEFMGASDFGKLLLFVRSVMWVLGVPQQAALILYEDNYACTSMAMSLTPTLRTRHIEIKNIFCCVDG